MLKKINNLGRFWNCIDTLDIIERNYFDSDRYKSNFDFYFIFDVVINKLTLYYNYNLYTL